MLDILFVNQSLLAAILVAILAMAYMIITVSKMKPTSAQSEEQIPVEPITPSKTQRTLLNDRASYLSTKFPYRESRFTTKLTYGVTTYKKKRSTATEKSYRFEDLCRMSEGEYNTMCGLNMLFGLRQDIYEDLSYIKGNDIPLHYSTKDIMDYFNTEYNLDKNTSELVKREIIMYNWEIAGQEYRDMLSRLK